MELDRSKFVTPEVAAERAVRSGDWVDYGFGGGYPELMDRALAARKGRLTDVKIRGGLVIRPRIEVVECDPEQISFHYYSWHLGDYERKLQARGLVQFLPMILRSLPCLYRDRHIRCDAAFVPVSLPDAAWASPTTPGVPSSSPPARWSLRSTSACPGCKGWTAATASISRRRIISWRVSMNPCPCAPTGTPAPLISGSPSWWPRRFRTERSSPWGWEASPLR